jgi:MFS family permease
VGSKAQRILLLVAINGFVGAMVGIERTVLPLIAEAEFGIASKMAAIAFIVTFGITKATTNFFAGTLSERWGRRRLLILGWLIGLPVPLVLIWAPTWSWILVANVLLGMNQSLTWSMTVVMKVDLATPRSFGKVIGWNEFAGYAGLAVTAGATGVIASSYGLRPEPFYLGFVLALAGLGLSFFARETRKGSRETEKGLPEGRSDDPVPMMTVLARGTFTDAKLSAASLAGLVTNLKDGVLWGLLPILLASRALPIERVGTVVAVYPAVWAVSQLVFGPMSDRVGRRGLIGAGLVTQAAGVALFAMGGSFGAYLAASVVVGLGTGMVYPTLLAFVSDASQAEWRASALGVYRLWRDLGYAVGALGGGLVADALGLTTALVVTAACALVVSAWFAVRTTD